MPGNPRMTTGMTGTCLRYLKDSRSDTIELALHPLGAPVAVTFAPVVMKPGAKHRSNFA